LSISIISKVVSKKWVGGRFEEVLGDVLSDPRSILLEGIASLICLDFSSNLN
jgi:hypothetical protein